MLPCNCYITPHAVNCTGSGVPDLAEKHAALITQGGWRLDFTTKVGLPYILLAVTSTGGSGELISGLRIHKDDLISVMQRIIA